MSYKASVKTNGMKIDVSLKPDAMKKLTDGEIKAALMVAQQMRHEIITDAVIPFDTGHLQNVQTEIDKRGVKKGKIAIYHDTPYARRLYYHPEYNFQKTFNRNARGLWWEDWLRGNKARRPVQLFKIFYRKVTGKFVK